MLTDGEWRGGGGATSFKLKRVYDVDFFLLLLECGLFSQLGGSVYVFVPGFARFKQCL